MEIWGSVHKRAYWQGRLICPSLITMSTAKILNFYLSKAKRDRAAAAGGIFSRVVEAARTAGWQVILKDEDEAVEGIGHHLIYNRAVTEPFCLCLRRCHTDPFFRIESTNDRWDWDVAKKLFAPRPAFIEEEGFRRRWCNKLLQGAKISQQGHIFMPLQGKLFIHRHFQSTSPVKMIYETLKADPIRQIIATLHPKETYSVEEISALRAFGERFQVTDQPSLQVLAACDYVVTENSSMALTGFFAEKPAVLFANIDFHHIGASVAKLGASAAILAAQADPPQFATYLHWFFKRNAITSWADDAVDQIRARFRDHGWPM